MSQIKIDTKAFNGIRQNVFVKESVTPSFRTEKQSKTYPNLIREPLANGFTEEVHDVEYPITSESVSSYADSSDYRNDPLGAIANAPKRVNLGDVSQIQEFIKQNPQEAVSVLRNVLVSLADKVDGLKNQQSQQVQNNPTGGNAQ